MTPQALLAPARLARKPILATQTDERLVDLVRAGYEPAFEAIVARYRAQLLGYCRRFLPEARAEDVVQQALVNAYAAIRQGDGELRLRAWLYRIAHNTALNALRDRGLRHEQLSEQIDGVERPDQALERRQDLRETVAAVQALPERQRDALVLRELEGRSYEEIAAELGVSDGAVRQLLNRARTRLRDGATALTPIGLITRLPWSDAGDPVAGRIAEVCGASAGVVAAKVCATALVTGAIVGGVVALPRDHGPADRTPAAEAATPVDAAGESSRPQGAEDRHEGSGSRAVGTGPSSSDRRGLESGDDGSGTSGDQRDSSGPGGGGDSSGSSGSGSDGSGSGSSGSGSGDSVSGDSGSSGSGSSGSGSDGSGSSGSGSGDSSSSGSGSSGSGDLTVHLDGDSGSGSSGSSGSGETTTTTTTDSSSDGH